MSRYLVTTFGCQMNVHDSERMEDVLQSAGHVPVADIADAEVVVLNTCSVREKAEQKLLSELGRLARRKQERPELVVVVTGCVAQQEGEALLKKARGVDLVLGPDNLAELPRLLEDVAHGAPPRVRTVFDNDSPRFLSLSPGAAEKTSVSSFVTTMKGCNERCSFCIVPTTRGSERYRPSGEIIDEISNMVEAGVREVTLLGQTVNSYKDPLQALGAAPEADSTDPDESEFAALLWAIAERVPGLARLRYTSPHPRHLTKSLIRAHADLPIMPRHVHLPVQSGSDRQLRRMIRRYTRAEYETRVANLRERVPGVTLSTDVIVGFPGETEDDFEQTLSLIAAVNAVGVFGFKYSPRPHTPALKLGDDVSEAEKSARLARLFELSEGQIRKHLGTLLGSEQTVLIDGPSKQTREGGPATFAGRSFRNEIVHIRDDAAAGLVGHEVKVRVAEALKHSLIGELDVATQQQGRELSKALPRPTRRRGLPMVSSDGP